MLVGSQVQQPEGDRVARRCADQSTLGGLAGLLLSRVRVKRRTAGYGYGRRQQPCPDNSAVHDPNPINWSETGISVSVTEEGYLTPARLNGNLISTFGVTIRQ